MLVFGSERERYTYQRSVSTSWDGRVEGGGTGSGTYNQKKLWFEIKNLEQEPRFYWFEWSEYKDRSKTMLKSRMNARSPKLRPGEAWSYEFALFTDEEFDSFALDEFRVINENDIIVEKVDARKASWLTADVAVPSKGWSPLTGMLNTPAKVVIALVAVVLVAMLQHCG